MGKSPMRRAIPLTCVTAVLSFGMYAVPAGIARAETSAAFTAHYEHLAQVETQLEARAQALTPAQSEHGATVARAVQAMNTNITSLYTAEQALLAAGARPLPPGRMQQEILPALRQAKAAIATEIQACTNTPKRNPALKARLASLIASARGAQLQIAKDVTMATAAIKRPAFRRSPRLESDLIQRTITRLQTTAISLMNAWLLLADTAWVQSQPANITSLAYTSAAIALPAKHQPPVADPVGAQPQVKDASGQVLPNTGTYRLQGPPGAHGVTIDRVTGTVTVHPHATTGQYTVTYSQGRAKEQVILQVTP